MTLNNNSNSTVVDRIAEKLKADSAGAFFSEEDLYDLTKQALAVAFFTPFSERVGYETVTHPSRLVKIAQDQFDKHMQKAAADLFKEWVLENPEKVEKILEAAIKRQPEQIILSAITALFQQNSFSIQNQVMNSVRQGLNNATGGSF
jgi:hypothetical protein